MLKKTPFTNDDLFFKSSRMTEGGNIFRIRKDILLKAMGSHKYLKRTGVPGDYHYWYKAGGKIIEGKHPGDGNVKENVRHEEAVRNYTSKAKTRDSSAGKTFNNAVFGHLDNYNAADKAHESKYGKKKSGKGPADLKKYMDAQQAKSAKEGTHIGGMGPNDSFYKGYHITQSGGNFSVTTPKGESWGEKAVSVETAKKWIDAHIHEKRVEEGTGVSSRIGSGNLKDYKLKGKPIEGVEKGPDDYKVTVTENPKLSKKEMEQVKNILETQGPRVIKQNLQRTMFIRDKAKAGDKGHQRQMKTLGENIVEVYQAAFNMKSQEKKNAPLKTEEYAEYGSPEHISSHTGYKAKSPEELRKMTINKLADHSVSAKDAGDTKQVKAIQDELEDRRKTGRDVKLSDKEYEERRAERDEEEGEQDKWDTIESRNKNAREKMSSPFKFRLKPKVPGAGMPKPKVGAVPTSPNPFKKKLMMRGPAVRERSSIPLKNAQKIYQKIKPSLAPKTSGFQMPVRVEKMKAPPHRELTPPGGVDTNLGVRG